MKTIPLTIASNYVNDWGFWEALRELTQNALDHKDVTGEKITLGYHNRTKNFLVTSPNAKLQLSSLILGATEKADDSTVRGKFGEGYKLALLVLLRLGLSVKIYNQDEIWIPSFEYYEEFDTNLLTIKVYPHKTNNKSLIFAIKGLTQNMANKIKDRFIVDRENAIGFKTDFGTILTEERFKGKVFVGGLYVSTPDIDLQHGFDFDPQHVELGRDRGLIDSFNVQWLASKMWLSIQKGDTVALVEAVNSIYSGGGSTRYVGSVAGRNAKVTESVAEKFYSEFAPTAVPVTTETDAKRVLNDYDDAVPVIVKSSVKSVIEQSDKFREVKSDLTPRKHLTPNEIINELLSKYKLDLGPMYKVLVAELVPVSIRWVALKEEVAINDQEEF